jgi:uncharacterized membrane protein (UPF0127 family)
LKPLLTDSAGVRGLFVEGCAVPLATVLETAFESAARRKGLLGRSSLAASHALVIAPCSAVHTFAMRFPIDVLFARRDGRILKLRPNLKAGRMSGAFGAFAVIEMAAGTLRDAGTRVGDRLVVRSLDEPEGLVRNVAPSDMSK